MELTEMFDTIGASTHNLKYTARILRNYAESLRHIGMEHLSGMLIGIAKDIEKSANLINSAGNDYSRVAQGEGDEPE